MAYNENTPKKGRKGSLKWMQVLINLNPEVINRQLGFEGIEWRSPLVDDDYAEYRDIDFLDILGLNHLQDQLQEFWPRSGPQWDALGKIGDKVFLVEAKANIPEIKSSCAAINPNSIDKIKKNISDTKAFLGITENDNWLEGFYQYSNRLAHLFFLREICCVDAELVFIYFCDDPTHIPTSISAWEVALATQKRLMGINKLDNVSELFVSCKDLK